MATGTGVTLIAELHNDPERFDHAGRAYELLQEYFAGFPLETLRPLLRSNDIWTQRTASFIAAELGKESKPLVDDVIPLLDSADPHVQDYAMQVLAVCGEGDRADLFALVARKLASEHEGLRWEARNLLANASVPQLETAARFLAGQRDQEGHERGLRALAGAERMASHEVDSMFEDPDPLIQRYGAVVRERIKRLQSRR
jgi:hypothetical protein